MDIDTKWIEDLVRDIPDFPKPGIVFKDITPVLQDHNAFKAVVQMVSLRYLGKNIERVIGVESRGFLFGGPVAFELGCDFGIVRKAGKLPYKTIARTYDLEYGTATLEAHVDTVKPGERVIIVDDLLATGGTARATVELMRELGANVVGAVFLIELGFLPGRQVLEDLGVEVFAPLVY
ncbi:MAG: adenine phosphoribosyltransferase [Deltaproteobacteria bacterium]|nr:adenine phosphoribosyltransferase [Deltaproteobacteria bacterium]